MDEFARMPADDRRAFVEETAVRRDLTATIIEKDFWVCWTLRRLTAAPDLVGQLIFKGGTSLSKAYGIIPRFSEDIDLTIRRSATPLDAVASPMDAGIGSNERRRRIDALKAAAQEFVAAVIMPALARAIEAELGTTGWGLELDPDDTERQTLLFNYPRISGSGRGEVSDYIKPRIKLEFGARGDPDPFQDCQITPYVAEEFPAALPNALTSVPTLSVTRTFWEKATILHALYHTGKMREGLSRHYFDLLMLDRAGVSTAALAEPALLEQVVRNKRIMFADASASYDTATLAGLRLVPSTQIAKALQRDYAAMTEMFMVKPPAYSELLTGLASLEKRINQTGT